MASYARVITKAIERDGEIVLKAKCPGCGIWGEIDQDQLQSETSFICPECGHHGMVDGRKY